MTATPDPRRDPKTERWLDSIGVQWTFDADLPLHRIDQAASLANQVRHQPLDPVFVERYAADMRQGDQFPAIIVDSSAMAILAGNHRHAGARTAGHTTIAAYLVTGTPAQLLHIAVGDNRNHGKATTNAERVDHAIALVEAGVTGQDAARITGVPGPKITTVVGCRQAAKRLEGDPAHARFLKLSEGTRYALSQIDDTDVFCAAVDLTLAAALPVDVVRTIVDTTKAATTVDALRYLGALETDYEDRIAERGGNIRKASLSARAKFDNSITQIIDLDAAEVVAGCPSDDVKAIPAQRILRAAKVLQEAHSMLAGQKTKRRAA